MTTALAKERLREIYISYLHNTLDYFIKGIRRIHKNDAPLTWNRSQIMNEIKKNQNCLWL